MKLWKHTLITALAFFGISTTVLYTSCEKDSCLDLRCKNGGSCADGFCRCPTGYEGTECEIKSANKFVGTFYGNVSCGSLPPLTDTVDVFFFAEPNQLKLVQHSRITDTIVGTAVGNNLLVNQVTADSYKKNVNGVLDNNKITVYVEEVHNTNTGDKDVCYFIGFKN
jgi:hypothetical protein